MFKRTYFNDTQVTTPRITEAAVTEDKLANDAVTSPKIKNAAIQTEDIADKAITLAKLGDDVPAVGIPDNSIPAAKLADNAVERRHISAAAVDSSQLAVSSVTTEKLRDAGVTNAKIANNAITSGKIATGAVGTTDIANGAVTAVKLDPALSLGDRFVWGAEGQTGNPRSSVEALYLTDISADIPYTSFDLSTWVPANAKAVILQLGIFNQAFTSGRAFFRVRTNADQRDSIGVGVVPGQNSMSANQGIVPLQPGVRSIEYALESVGGPWTATFTLYITIVGYIV